MMPGPMESRNTINGLKLGYEPKSMYCAKARERFTHAESERAWKTKNDAADSDGRREHDNGAA